MVKPDAWRGASDPGVRVAGSYRGPFHVGGAMIIETLPATDRSLVHDRMMAELRAKVDKDRELIFPDRMITFPPGVKLRFDNPGLCFARDRGGFHCTLPPGHAGNHEAYGRKGTLISTWGEGGARCPHCGRKMDHQGRIIMGLLALATIAGAIAVIEFLGLVAHGIIRL